MKFVTQESTCGRPISDKPQKNQNSRSQMYGKIGGLKNFANFTGKYLCWSLFSIQLQAWGPAKNTFICRTPPVAVSEGCFFEVVIIIDTIKPASQCSPEDK